MASLSVLDLDLEAVEKYGISGHIEQIDESRLDVEIRIAKTGSLRRGSLNIGFKTPAGVIRTTWEVEPGRQLLARFSIPKSQVENSFVTLTISEASEPEIELFSACYQISLSNGILFDSGRPRKTRNEERDGDGQKK